MIFYALINSSHAIIKAPSTTAFNNNKRKDNQ